MATIRQQILELLDTKPLTARDISQMLGVSEKDVPAHLEHAAKTARQTGKRLVVEPFSCLDCGYVFRERSRFTKPGRCPRCRGSYVESPRFALK